MVALLVGTRACHDHCAALGSGYRAADGYGRGMDIGRVAPVPVDLVARAPKVLLHDHLDGGLRPATVIELAQEAGYRDLPAGDPQTLATWFAEAAYSGSLERYLETFRHTVGVTQTAAALARVARECAEDLADDGVVYAEVRFAPELHL